MRLFKEIAEASIKFYTPKPGQYIAIQLANGKIVATDDTKYELLTKIQEKIFQTNYSSGEYNNHYRLAY